MYNNQIEKSTWREYECFNINLNGYEGTLIIPPNPTEDKRWIWRTEFLGAFDKADISMVEKGWYLSCYKISDMYGSPKAVELMWEFQKYLVEQFNLYKKTVLFGFSRGGLYAFNYAVAYPMSVDALYLDAPVLDIRSWPGGLGAAERYEKEWQECLKEYEFTEVTAANFNQSPIDKIEQLAKANIPLIIVAGGADEVVPFNENSKKMADRLMEKGCKVKLIVKPDCGHHPHSLDNPVPIVEFILENTRKIFRYGSVIRVKPEKLEEYKQLHANAWSSVLDMIKKCNIQNYSIYYKDGFLFSYFEYVGKDYDADMAKMAEDSITQQWWAVCKPCQKPLETANDGEWWAEMEEVFHLD